MLTASRIAGAEGNVQLALVGQAVVDQSRNALGHGPFEFDIVVVGTVGEYRRGSGAPHRRGCSFVPAGAGANGVVIGITIEEYRLEVGVAEFVDRVDLVRRALPIDDDGRKVEPRVGFDRRHRGLVDEIVDDRADGILIPTARVYRLPRVGQQGLVLNVIGGVVEIGHVQYIASADRDIRPDLAGAVGREPYPALAAAIGRRTDAHHREGGGLAIDLRQHDIVSAGAAARTTHISNKNVVALVDDHARKARRPALSAVANRGRVVNHNRAIARQPRRAAVLRVIEIDIVGVTAGASESSGVAVGRVVEGVDHPRVAAAIDLDIDGREGAAGIGDIQRQQIVAQRARNADRRREGPASIFAARVAHVVDRRRHHGAGLLRDPRHVENAVGIDRDVGAQTIDIAALDLFALFYIVEVAVDRMGRGRGLIEIGPHRNLATEDKILLGSAVLG